MGNFERPNLDQKQQDLSERVGFELNSIETRFLREAENTGSPNFFKMRVEQIEGLLEQRGVELPKCYKEKLKKIGKRHFLECKCKELEDSIRSHKSGIRSNEKEGQKTEWEEELKETERLLEELSGESPPAAS